MVNESRIDLYDYLYNLFYDVVTKNVYAMREPSELTQSDSKDGFIVIRVGSINDASEFVGEAYARVRCYVQAFVPPISRGRLDYDKYAVFENAIVNVIKNATEDENASYYIESDDILSSDAEETENANNAFYTFIKSFIVVIDNQEE